jgi:outer membrane protein W
MRIILTAIMILISITCLNAQNHDFKHFEETASVNFWTPSALHFKASDNVTQYSYPNGSYLSEGALTGYGTSLAPGINIKYYFKKNVGLSLGLCMIHMDKELSIIETDSTHSNYENIADIPNFTLGITGKFLPSESLEVFYEAGIDFVSGYGLEMQYSSESADPPDMNADGLAMGVYGKTGVAFKLFSSFFFNTSLTYSYIPAEIEYTNTEGSAKTNLSTNLGGYALETGISFHF